MPAWMGLLPAPGCHLPSALLPWPETPGPSTSTLPWGPLTPLLPSLQTLASPCLSSRALCPWLFLLSRHWIVRVII